mmetsp:Transcript_4844/g.14710  ORF Transcript_4844/g.14710 Transcript_4844/m.14710 type:complete len:238 (+) Transcript_4844:3269-3982(+)
MRAARRSHGAWPATARCPRPWSGAGLPCRSTPSLSPCTARPSTRTRTCGRQPGCRARGVALRQPRECSPRPPPAAPLQTSRLQRWRVGRRRPGARAPATCCRCFRCSTRRRACCVRCRPRGLSRRSCRSRWRARLQVMRLAMCGPGRAAWRRAGAFPAARLTAPSKALVQLHGCRPGLARHWAWGRAGRCGCRRSIRASTRLRVRPTPRTRAAALVFCAMILAPASCPAAALRAAPA